ncbi:MAG: hypothetical protein IJQ80_08205, partial [Clostridia bacterium]|nr:hypothetical protein [Clostridia bacterium]
LFEGKTAVISSASFMNICEYVVCDNKELTLTYVYLDGIKEKEIIFDKKYLPRGFQDYSTIEGVEYTIYPDVEELDSKNR